MRLRTAAMLSLPHKPQAAVARSTRRAAEASSLRPGATVTSTTLSRSRPAEPPPCASDATSSRDEMTPSV